MRPLQFLRLLAAVTLLALLPVIGAIATYANEIAEPAAMRAPAYRTLLDDPNINGPAPMAGQNVVSTEGQRVGAVTAVRKTASGHVREMLFSTGGFWGFGSRTVAIPAGRFAVTGQDVFINFSAKDIARLPATNGS